VIFPPSLSCWVWFTGRYVLRDYIGRNVMRMVPWSVLRRALRHTCSVMLKQACRCNIGCYFVFRTRSDVPNQLAVVQLVKSLVFWRTGSPGRVPYSHVYLNMTNRISIFSHSLRRIFKIMRCVLCLPVIPLCQGFGAELCMTTFTHACCMPHGCYCP
jgi:hypothetical protein